MVDKKQYVDGEKDEKDVTDYGEGIRKTEEESENVGKGFGQSEKDATDYGEGIRKMEEEQDTDELGSEEEVDKRPSGPGFN